MFLLYPLKIPLEIHLYPSLDEIAFGQVAVVASSHDDDNFCIVV